MACWVVLRELQELLELLLLEMLLVLLKLVRVMPKLLPQGRICLLQLLSGWVVH
jgi:hypothetical protein